MAKKWFKVREEGLTEHGYSLDKVQLSRRRALNKAVKASSAIEVFRRLHAIANVTQKSQPKNSKKYLTDAEYVKKKFYNTKTLNNDMLYSNILIKKTQMIRLIGFFRSGHLEKVLFHTIIQSRVRCLM